LVEFNEIGPLAWFLVYSVGPHDENARSDYGIGSIFSVGSGWGNSFNSYGYHYQPIETAGLGSFFEQDDPDLG
jgi:hypothetical protein